MATELRMPQMGYDMEEGTVVKWLVQEGETVKRNAPIAEIETDKAVVEFETETEGTILKILASEGSVIPVGQTIVVVGSEGEEFTITEPLQVTEDSDTPVTENVEISNKIPEISENNVATDPEITPSSIIASPIARKLAEDLGIPLSKIQGSGPNGRITKTDVENFQDSDDEQVSETISTTPETTQAPPEVTPVKSSSNNSPSDKQPLSRMRQQIARVTVKSKSEKPHFYVSAEIDMTRAMALRKQINEQLSPEGVKITVNDLIVKASIETLKKFPKFNAYYEEDGIVYNDSINIAIAISDDEGLIVPAILDCGDKSLRQISQMVKDLAQRSSNGTLSPQEYTGGTFAISNLGMYDVTSFVAIIHPPQSAVLAVGTVTEKPVVKDGEIVIAQTMVGTISADHRIVDGAEGAEFLVAVKSLLENPMSMVV
ncbi:MAG: 2-oxo acid dehydrogenase subunit E2 [SAR202 cluster bacterium]|nr:2-oxo acid dehydrogenase subunit E2 [SAR202 cluster bacterium]